MRNIDPSHHVGGIDEQVPFRNLAELASRPEESRIVVHFEGPLQPGRRAALESSGIRLLSYLGGYAYFATLSSGVDRLPAPALSGMLAVEPIDPANKLHPDLARGEAPSWSIVSGAAEEPAGPQTVALYVLFHRDFDFEQRAEEVILRYGGPALYERSQAFFLGLIAGQFFTTGFWLVVDYFTGRVGNSLPQW